jgi:hypothetical protein
MREAKKVANSQPTTSAHRLTSKPHIIVSPKSAPMMPAAATGPGVGGTMVWVAYSPRLSAIALAARVMPALRASAFISGDSSTKPESQNTGMETT